MAEPIVTVQTPNFYGPAQSFGLTNRYDYKGLDPELALAERAADQRQLIANAILNQSSVPRRGKMVGRLYQRAHWAEGLGQLGEAAAGMYLSNKIQDARKDAEEKSQTGQAAELAAYRQAIDPRAATESEMVPNVRGINSDNVAQAMMEQLGVQPSQPVPSQKGPFAVAPMSGQYAQFNQPAPPTQLRASVDPAAQAQADAQAAAQAAYASDPNAGGYNMKNAPEAVMNPAPAPAASVTPSEVPSVDLAQQLGMLERPAQAAFTPTPQQERAAVAALRTSQYAANREYGKDEMTRLRDEQAQRIHDAERAQDQALHLTERGQDQEWKQKDLDRQYAEITQRKNHDKGMLDQAKERGLITDKQHQEQMAQLERNFKQSVLQFNQTFAATAQERKAVHQEKKDSIPYKAAIRTLDAERSAVQAMSGQEEDLRRFSALNKGVVTGPMMGHVPAFSADRASMEQIEAKFVMGPQLRQGSISNFEREYIKQSNPSTNTVREANEANIKIRLGAIATAKEQLDFREGWVDEHSSLTGADKVWNRYVEANPRYRINKKTGVLEENSDRQTWDAWVPSSASSPSNPTTPAGSEQTNVDEAQKKAVNDVLKKYK